MKRSPIAIVTVVLLATSGCGMSLPLRHARVATLPAPPHATSLAEQIADARAHAAQAPGEAYWPWRAAALYAGADSIAAAESMARRALARDPEYVPALSLLSKLEYDTGRHDEAVQLLEAARARARASSRELEPELLAGLALHYQALGRADLARQALAAVPDDAHDLSGSAAAVIALRNGDAPAAELARAAAHDHPKSAACQNNYGVARLKVGDATGARKAFMKAIELDPARPGPYYNLAILEKYYALDDEAAAKWFARFRERSSDDPDGLAQTLGKPEPKGLAEGREP